MKSLPEAVSYLAEAGAAAPSADNSQPWRLFWGKTLDLWYRQPDGPQPYLGAHHPATLLALGAVIENLAQAAAAISLPFADAFGSGDGSEPILRLAVSPDTEVPLEARAHPLFHRHTNRFPYRAEPLSAGLLKWPANEREPPARCLVLEQDDNIAAMAGLMRQASEVRFQTREIHEWLGRSLRLTPQEARRGDGLDVATLDLPPGGRQMLRFIREWKRMTLLNRLGAYKTFARMEAAAIAKAPALLAILAPAGASSAMAAGRLLERVWIELNRVGVAVHPYFAITDQLYRLKEGSVPAGLIPSVEQTKLALYRLLDSDDEQMLMLLRLGRPKVQPPRSMRLPLAKILTPSSVA